MKTKKQNSHRNRLFMNHRRYFIKLILGGVAGLGLIFSPLSAGIRMVWARAKKIILPEKHGFPLRVVAEDYYGGDGVKYVYRLTAIKS